MEKFLKALIVFTFLVSTLNVCNGLNNHLDNCKNKPSGFTINGHNYFYSGFIDELRGKEVSWQAARDFCHEYCMDTISIESQAEFDKGKSFCVKSF